MNSEKNENLSNYQLLKQKPSLWSISPHFSIFLMIVQQYSAWHWFLKWFQLKFRAGNFPGDSPAGTLWSLSRDLKPVSRWYVYPRDMCIPVHISLVICVSLQYGCQWNVYPLPSPPPPPPLQTSVGFISVVFVNLGESSSRGLQVIQDYE